MHRNLRREAREAKRIGAVDGFPALARGNHLAAQNDEPEPGEMRRFRVTPVCGGRQVGQSMEVMGPDAMTVAAQHKGWAAMYWGAHPRVTPVGEDVPAPFRDDDFEREQLHRAIQDETQLALVRGW